MSEGLLTLAYLAAAALFIGSLGGLSKQTTAPRGNLLGIAGMIIAVVATLGHPVATAPGWAFLALGLGAVVGLPLAARVRMTEMPQLVAILHSFVGLAAVLVGLSTFAEPVLGGEGDHGILHGLEIFADVTIGALTFAGSVVAWAKLDGRMSGKPLLLPNRHALNAGALVLLALLAVPTLGLGSGMVFLILAAIVAALLGAHLVLAIGGADMPVVVSLLNSYSGWTAAAAGFMLSNDLLIITGALVGSSGAILSYIMCEAMNRSIWNVVFGGFGTADTKGAAAPEADAEGLEVHPIEAPDLAALLAGAKRVAIVPGYGMAVARAQNSVRSLVDALQARDTEVFFAIHPVAGRLPGHMNVLLAEAGVPYGLVHEMEEVNGDLPETDVVVVIGANDIVNPSAQTDPHSPIAGMPVLEAWKAKHCVVLKRGMSTGYAGVQNPLFFHDNTRMYFGDARERVDDLVGALRG